MKNNNKVVNTVASIKRNARTTDKEQLKCECGQKKDGGDIGNYCHPSNCPKNF